jgi:CRISPR-associated exonuclease, Cas4 family
MKDYKEENFLQLAGIQHFAFCRRQWALIHIENQWEDNVRTVEGQIIHDKAHDKFALESRGDLLISRGMPVFSASLGISGECDVVEFHKNNEGINIAGKDGLYSVVPIEYKRGKENRMILTNCNLQHRLCALRKCFVVVYLWVICIIMKQDVALQ